MSRGATTQASCPGLASHTDKTMPQAVQWSWRGLGALPSREMGVLVRRRLAMAATVVMRLTTCATPVWPGGPPFCTPQLPVAKAYWKPEVRRARGVAQTQSTTACSNASAFCTSVLLSMLCAL